jgi:hypothetical protein
MTKLWHTHKERIIKHYLTDDKTLTTVKQIMESEHNFHAS